MAVESSTWFCCSQLVKDVIESSRAAAAACSLSSGVIPSVTAGRLLESEFVVSLMSELFMVLLFGVQWFCSSFPVERCPEMELVQTCSSTSS
ncbi:hypothetical protein DAPPUDRAFT_336458 [Daphnia pulex]|uniref:Uncharacterized protein n=1 Tax=Daphnia pulex TaxID=6669 RepID=E9HZR4_DAPPU|nr:hypothetical protein DAPPUDRAFT_336458 [Daphnia pulex]|eukprot:EFX62766.1 hypothetical protein DAPPUDRAFT_336458 [Daphnia pulex]